MRMVSTHLPFSFSFTPCFTMIPLAAALAILPAFLTYVVGAVDVSSVAPTIVLDKATFVGIGDGTTRQFLGIPYAKPP